MFSTGQKFDFYPEVREILLALHEAEIPIALASSTWTPKLFLFFSSLSYLEDRN